MVRETWTDERLDDLANRTDEGFREVRADIRQMRSELTSTSESLRAEIGHVRGELGEIRAELQGLNRTMQIGFGLIGAVLTGILGLMAALFTIQL